MRPSRTAFHFDSSGWPVSASFEPGQVPTRTASGSATNARSAPGGSIPTMPISRPRLTAPAVSIKAPIAVSAPAVMLPDQ